MVERRMDAANGPIARDAAGHGEPGAKADLRNCERAIAEAAVLHFLVTVQRT
jgi:hypothetical protein